MQTQALARHARARYIGEAMNDVNEQVPPLHRYPAFVSLWVSDFSACLEFYCGLLGFEQADRMVGPSGQCALLRFAPGLELMLAEPGALPALESAESRTSDGPIVIPHPDAAGAWRVIARRGKQLGLAVPKPSQCPLGLTLHLTDPDGRTVLLTQHDTKEVRPQY